MDRFSDGLMGDRGWLQRVVGVIPGYSGYTQKERRRDVDKELRTYIVRKLQEVRVRVLDRQRQRSKSGWIEGLDDLDRLGRKLEKLQDRVNTATYGASGFFDTVQVREPELDALYAYDRRILDQVSDIEKLTTTPVADAEPALPPDWEKQIDVLEELVDERKDVIDQVKGI